MPYLKQTWVDGPVGGTPLSATRLSHLEDGVAAVTSTADTLMAQVGSDAWLKLYAAVPDALIVGAITRDVNEAAISASVVWPDGTPGVYTATVLNTDFPGAVDAYIVTYGSPTVKTVTQPVVTRDTTGAVTNRPAMTVA